MKLIQEGELKGTVSTITISELLMKPYEVGLDKVRRRKKELERIENLEITDFRSEMADKAAYYRGTENYWFRDAAIIATSTLKDQITLSLETRN